MSDLSRKPEFVREVRRLIRREYRRPWWTAWAVLIVAFAGVAYAATVLFTHTAPGVSVPSPLLATSCSTLYLTSLSGTTSTGAVATLTCKGGVAFTASASGSVAYALTPGGYSQVWVYDNATPPSGGCSGTQLAPSGAFPVTAAAGYDYCAVIPSGVASPIPFSVQWSQ